ncbi:Alpha/Beta hydrolase protein [Mycena crocata]|nr:Alpha/Beta hydrolase protein [Mycena crocata]
MPAARGKNASEDPWPRTELNRLTTRRVKPTHDFGFWQSPSALHARQHRTSTFGVPPHPRRILSYPFWCIFTYVALPNAIRPGWRLRLGGGSEWNGTSLVRRSVATNKPFIYISVSYRLGVLGFLSSAQVPASALNVGLLDQRAALRWIQDNAQAFGGDPSRVTISGESAGAGSVHMHYIYPDTKPTFRAGISSSGTSLVVNMHTLPWVTPRAVAPAHLVEVLTFQHSQTFWPLAVATYALGYPLWSPCKGPQGSLIEDYPVGKVIAGDFLKLPIIIGTNENEGGFTLYDRAVQFQTDYLFVAPQRVFLKSASAKERKQNVWAYSFQQHLPGALAFLGVFHSTDLYYLDMCFGQVPTSNLRLQVQDIYISFANDANPGIDWPQYDEEAKMVMPLADGRDTVGLSMAIFQRFLSGAAQWCGGRIPLQILRDPLKYDVGRMAEVTNRPPTFKWFTSQLKVLEQIGIMD